MARVFNSRILLFIIAVLLISNIGMLAFWYSMTRGDHRPPRGNNGWSPMSTFLEKKVGFNKEQMQTFDSVRSQHRQKLKPMFEDLKMSKIKFYKLLNQSDLSDSLISSEAATIGNMQKAVDVQTLKNFRELREICTDQQRPVYDSLVPGMISDMWFPNRRGMEKPQK